MIPYDLTGPGIDHTEVHISYQNLVIPQLGGATLSTQVKSSDWQSLAGNTKRTNAFRDHLFARVADDDSVDVLKGRKDQDWYFAALTGSVADRVKHLRASELAEELAGLGLDD